MRPLVIDDQPDRAVQEWHSGLSNQRREAESVGCAMPGAQAWHFALSGLGWLARRLGDATDGLNIGRDIAFNQLMRAWPANDRAEDDGEHQESCQNLPKVV